MDPEHEQQHWDEFEAADGRALTAGDAAVRRSRLGWPVISWLAGMGLRAAHVPHPVWLVAVVIAVLVTAGTAGRELLLRRAAGAGEPEWAGELGRYRQWLPRRRPPVPEAVLTAADGYLAAMASGPWQSAQLIIARRPPDVPWMTMAGVERRGTRLVVHLDEQLACDSPAAALGALAHEARHQRGGHRLLRALGQTGFDRGYLIAGWAAPWPDAVWAAISVHLLLILVSWINETGCDIAAASDTGRQAMMAALSAMAAARRASPASPGQRALRWLEGPPHPPVPVRRVIVRAWCWLRPQPAPPLRPDRQHTGTTPAAASTAPAEGRS
jgi:hypothetical protein